MAETETQALPGSGDETAGPMAGVRGVLAQLIIWLTTLFVLLLTALFWYRWTRVALPTSNIIVFGTPATDGSEATVTRDGVTVARVTLTRGNNRECAIWVTPGIYRFIATLNGQTIKDVSIPVQEMRSIGVFLVPAGTIPSTLPTTQPGAGPESEPHRPQSRLEP